MKNSKKNVVKISFDFSGPFIDHPRQLYTTHASVIDTCRRRPRTKRNPSPTLAVLVLLISIKLNPSVILISTHKMFGSRIFSQFPRHCKTNKRSWSNALNQISVGRSQEEGSYQNFVSMLLPTLALVGATVANTNTAENCGIVGVVGADDAKGYLLEGLTILRNRGYDSAGIATISSNGTDLSVTKFASRDSTSDSIDLVKANSANHVGHISGIAHTRWATHGGKTDQNAHPHTDQKKRVAIVHNGTINNSYDLKKELQAAGVQFSSETDTEVIAQLIGTYLDKGFDTKEAVSHALSRFIDS